jgi:hypothetical protein
MRWEEIIDHGGSYQLTKKMADLTKMHCGQLTSFE